jgi:poly-beta-1,6-N-acetyl-D-glucosamine synthase
VEGAEPDRTLDLVGGVVAFNEERRLALAVQSLLEQELPPGARWRTIWVVASGCTDRSPDVARELAAKYPEVQAIIEPERRGKASALRQIIGAAQGDYLILLNGDAVAGPGAVAELLRTAAPIAPPFAVMGHPEPTEVRAGIFGAGIRLLWKLHHRLHEELVRTETGTHLSDELLLLPTSHLPTLP